MPTYDFYCRICNEVRVFRMKISEYLEFRNVAKCCKCDSRLERKITPFTFRMEKGKED